MRVVLFTALILLGCAERPEEVSAQRFRAESERALQREAASDVIAELTKREWRVTRPARDGVLSEEQFYDWLGKYDGARRLAVVVFGKRDQPVRTQRDLDDLQEAIDVIDKAVRAAGFEKVAFHQRATFGRAILRE